MKSNEDGNFTIGKNAVFEALKSEAEINFIMVLCKISNNIFDLPKGRVIVKNMILVN